MIDLRCSFLVVTSGKPSARSNRIWWPKMLRVPVPVRSLLATPSSRIRCMRSRYCRMRELYRATRRCREPSGTESGSGESRSTSALLRASARAARPTSASPSTPRPASPTAADRPSSAGARSGLPAGRAFSSTPTMYFHCFSRPLPSARYSSVTSSLSRCSEIASRFS